MPPRWPSSARPASQAPRCGTATFRVSCDHAPLVPAIIPSAPSAATSLFFVVVIVVVIVVPPVAAAHECGRDYLSRYTRALQATIGREISRHLRLFGRCDAALDTV